MSLIMMETSQLPPLVFALYKFLLEGRFYCSDKPATIAQNSTFFHTFLLAMKDEL